MCPRTSCRSRVLISSGLYAPEFFYRTHDPTTLNKQGNDVGTRTSRLTSFFAASSSLCPMFCAPSRIPFSPFPRVPLRYLLPHPGAGADREARHGRSAEEALRPCRCVYSIHLCSDQYSETRRLQARRLSHKFCPQVRGGTQRSTTNCTSSRTRRDTSARTTAYTGDTGLEA